MKINTGLAVGLSLGLALAACSAGGDDEPAVLTADYDGALPVQTQLIVGTFQLESTELAVSSAQADELIPLWQAVRSLTGSDTAAQAEIEAVIKQIQDTMTAEQIEAIAALQLTQDKLLSVMDELGLARERLEGFEGFGEGGAFQIPPGGFPGGGGPGGGAGPGGGGFPGGQLPGAGQGNLDPDTLQAERGGAGGFAGRAGRFLIDPLIELLEAKADDQT